MQAHASLLSVLRGQFPYLPWRVCCLITCLIENKTVVSVSEGFYQMINYSCGFACCSSAEKWFYCLILVLCLWVYTVMHVFLRCYKMLKEIGVLTWCVFYLQMRQLLCIRVYREKRAIEHEVYWKICWPWSLFCLHEQCPQWDTGKSFLNQFSSKTYICSISFNISPYVSHERFMFLPQLFFLFLCLLFLKRKEDA